MMTFDKFNEILNLLNENGLSDDKAIPIVLKIVELLDIKATPVSEDATFMSAFMTVMMAD